MNLQTNCITCLVKIFKNDLMTCDFCLRHYHRKCINRHPPVNLTTNISNQKYASCSLCRNRSVFFNSGDSASNLNYNDVFKNCLYYDDKSLNRILKNQPNDLLIMHFNIRSLQKNIDALITYVLGLERLPDVIGITKTKLISGQTHTKIDINGYTFLHHDTTTKAGGVAFYIKKTLDL